MSVRHSSAVIWSRCSKGSLAGMELIRADLRRRTLEVLACREGGYKASGRSEKQQPLLIAVRMQPVRLSTPGKGFLFGVGGFRR